MNKTQSWNISAVFIIFIFGISLATLLKPDRGFSERENRVLASFPQADAGNVFSGKFESDYEEYLTDQFVLRDKWIALRTISERAALRSEVHGVYFGKENYLIEKHDGIFETDMAKNNVSALIKFANSLESEHPGINTTVMLIPNAVDVLKDELPLLARPYDEEKYIDSLREGLNDGIFFDAGEVLKNNRQYQLYYKTDHHWTTDGAFSVFCSWMSRKGYDVIGADQYEVTTVTDSFEGTIASKVGIKVESDEIKIYKKNAPAAYSLIYNKSDDVRHTAYQPHVLDGRDKYSYFYGGNYGLIEGETTASTGRRILVIKDSYAHCFVPFLYDYFDKVDMVDLRYYNGYLSELIDEGEYTDVLFLENAAGFAEDMSIAKLLV